MTDYSCIKIELDIEPEMLFQAMSENPWAIFLDSASKNHVNNDVSIIGWSPEIIVTTDDFQTMVKRGNESSTSKEDPFEILDELYQSLNLETHQIDLKYCPSFMGYFGYDLNHNIESLPNLTKHDIAMPRLAVGLYTTMIVFEHNTKTSYLVCRKNEESLRQSEIASWQTQQGHQFELVSDWQSNMTQDSYTEKFNRVQDYLLSGDCYQINLAQRFTAQYRGNEYLAYLALREANEAPFSSFMRVDEGTVLSISPERFLSIRNGEVETKPIKGTRPRFEDKVADEEQQHLLLESEKDRAENLMIVDLLRNDLSKIATSNSVNVPALFEIESFPAVHHLVSTVTAKVKTNLTPFDVIRAAFPGGSITGAPKIRAMEIIEELEPHQRSVYCGAIGYIDLQGNMDTNITIRTLVCENQRVHCWAGGGLVADSDAWSEYKETFDKVSKILPVLSEM